MPSLTGAGWGVRSGYTPLGGGNGGGGGGAALVRKDSEKSVDSFAGFGTVKSSKGGGVGGGLNRAPSAVSFRAPLFRTLAREGESNVEKKA